MNSKETIREIYKKGKVMVNASIAGQTVPVSVEKGALVKTIKEQMSEVDFSLDRKEDGSLFIG
jgi:hypothetical protein